MALAVALALAEVVAKSVGEAAILHNFHYNYGFGNVLADVGSIIMPIM